MIYESLFIEVLLYLFFILRLIYVVNYVELKASSALAVQALCVSINLLKNNVGTFVVQTFVRYFAQNVNIVIIVT